MCRANYSNCRGVSIPSHGLCIPCEGQVYIFDWIPCERAKTRSICEPTFHPDPAGDVEQCEKCEEIERQTNPRSLVEKSSIYRLHCPSRNPPSYAPPPYVSPPPYFGSSNSSIAGTPRPARTSYLQLPPSTQFAETPYAESFPQRRYTVEEYYAPTQDQPSSPSCSLHSSASDESLNTRAAVTSNIINSVSLLLPPPMPVFPESPYIGTQGMATSTNREQQPIQILPPVAQPLNCRRPDGYNSHEEESPREPRALGLRSQLYENELQGPRQSSTWNTFSGWIRKAGERITGQGRSNQHLSRSRQLARQPRVKPQRKGMEAWVALSSNFDHVGE